MRDVLALFVGDRPDNKDLHDPFSVGRYSYATDGRAIIRVPRHPDIPEKTSGVPPVGVIAMVPLSPVWSNLGEVIPALIPLVCDECDGIGHVGLCHECHGDGAVSFKTTFNGYSAKCKTCSGRGRLSEGPGVSTCEACSGSGKVLDRSTLHEAFPGAWIPLDVLHKLATLPLVKVSPLNEDTLAVRFQGGVGVVALRSPPEYNIPP